MKSPPREARRCPGGNLGREGCNDREFATNFGRAEPPNAGHEQRPSSACEHELPTATPEEKRKAVDRTTLNCSGTPTTQPCHVVTEKNSTCCGYCCSGNHAGSSPGNSNPVRNNGTANEGNVPQTGVSQEPLRITCSIIRHMSADAGLNAVSALPGAAQAPPQPKCDSSVPKLWYFNARGRAELIRLIFAQAGVEYEDLRFRGPPYAMDDFRQFKQTHDLPFDQVPVLEIDGMLLAQSQAIVRYLSRKYNLMADDEVGNVKADMIFCGTEDLKQKFTTLLFSRGSGYLEETETLVQCFVKDTCQRWGSYFEKLLKKNGGVWMVGDHVTYADLCVYDVISSITWRLPTCFNQNGLLLDHSRRIESLPGIAAYLRQRPDVPI